MHQSRFSPLDSRDQGGSAIAGLTSTRRRWQGVLVVAEIGMAMMLLVGSGLLVRSFSNLVNVPPGY